MLSDLRVGAVRRQARREHDRGESRRARANERPATARPVRVCHRVGSWLMRTMGANRTCARAPRSANRGMVPGSIRRVPRPVFMLDASNVPPRALPTAPSASASSTSGACARSTAPPAGRARTAIEVELLAAGLLAASAAPLGHETMPPHRRRHRRPGRDAGRNRARRDAHELLVERVAREMTRAGRLAWRGLAVRARVDTRLGDGDARMSSDPPHDGRGLRRADRPRGQGAARRPPRRPAPSRASARPTSTSAASAGT